jgi:hypothetical protein
MAAGPRSGARRPIATHDSYDEAQATVDYLAERRFPVEHLTIVGEDLRYAEEITGRVGVGRAAAHGALNGAVVGGLVGFVLGLFTFLEPVVSALALALWGVVIGAVAGTFVGAVGHALIPGGQNFSSVGGLQAARYVVLADADVADDAERILRHRN